MDKAILERLIGKGIKSISPIGGGCIANSQKVIAEDGGRYFVKNYQLSGSKILLNEANGLKELRKEKAVRVPGVIAVDEEYLVLEFIESASKASNFWEIFGRQFAELHQYHGEYCGFYENNYIGETEQINLPRSKDWREFYWNNRLLYQIKLAERFGYLDNELLKQFLELENRLEDIIPDSEELPSLLHGDLWSGNFMVDEKGLPVLIDPAVYYGNREADLAMTKLFGGFNSRFYESYNETFPLQPGYDYREPIYKLYHVLNHLNLFGFGYLGQAKAILKFYN